MLSTNGTHWVISPEELGFAVAVFLSLRDGHEARWSAIEGAFPVPRPLLMAAIDAVDTLEMSTPRVGPYTRVLWLPGWVQ